MSNMLKCCRSGVALTPEQKIKGIASASAPSAFLGITEPAMFGVNLALRWPSTLQSSRGYWFDVTSILGDLRRVNGAAGYGFPD